MWLTTSRRSPSFGSLPVGFWRGQTLPLRFQVAMATAALVAGTLVGVGSAVGREPALRPTASSMAMLAYFDSPGDFLATPAYCGLSVAPVSPARLPDETGQGRGVLITSVATESPAAKAGLKTHDVLIRYDGHDVYSADQLQKLVESDKPGREVVVSFLRAGKVLETKMTLAQAAAADVVRSMPFTPVGKQGAKSGEPERWFPFTLPQAWRIWLESSLPSIQSASLDRQTK